jgi:hypothetical protein
VVVSIPTVSSGQREESPKGHHPTGLTVYTYDDDDVFSIDPSSTATAPPAGSRETDWILILVLVWFDLIDLITR